VAWIEIHTVLSRHRKLKELGIALGIKAVHAKGHLVSIWLTALEQQEDGDMRKWSDAFLAEAAEFDGDATAFRKTLEAQGWLDNGLIHDWLDYAGRYLMNKYASSNISRLKEIWAVHGRRYGHATGKQPKRNRNETTPYHTIPNLPNLTLPNQQHARVVLAHFNQVCHKTLTLTKDREGLISRRLVEGRTIEEMKKAITNFSKDDWPDRPKYMDLVYAIGVRNKIDNLDRWLNFTGGSNAGSHSTVKLTQTDPKRIAAYED
jgi:hypothetical protein